MKEMDSNNLSLFDGKEGHAALIAYAGKIFDVSSSRLWKNGLHMNRHQAGRDLSMEMEGAPHGPEVLDRFPPAGLLKVAGAPAPPKPGLAFGLLSRHPILKRHPHPMLVHFPIAFMYAVTVFNLLFLTTGAKGLETAAFYCLASAVLFTPVAVLTGYLTWRLNYGGKPMRPVSIKIRFSWILLSISSAAMSWRISAPEIAEFPGAAGVIYFLLIVSLAPVVTVIGWFGGQLTFPIER
ncbi:MAG: DUF2231 domain-containing protein [Syntrophales bacterium]